MHPVGVWCAPYSPHPTTAIHPNYSVGVSDNRSPPHTGKPTATPHNAPNTPAQRPLTTSSQNPKPQQAHTTRSARQQLFAPPQPKPKNGSYFAVTTKSKKPNTPSPVRFPPQVSAKTPQAHTLHNTPKQTTAHPALTRLLQCTAKSRPRRPREGGIAGQCPHHRGQSAATRNYRVRYASMMVAEIRPRSLTS